MKFSDDIKYLKGVGPKISEKLAKADIYTLGDLLTYFPRTYLDWSVTVPIGEAPFNENVCIRAYVGSVVREHIIRKGMTTYTVDITDGRDIMSVVFFNNKYVKNMLKNGEEYLFYGKITGYGSHSKSMTSPKFSVIGEGSLKMKPIYPQTNELNSSLFEKLIKNAFENVDDIEDCLPENIRNSYCLMNYRDALYNIHFPQSYDLLSEAKRRIGFEELFLLQIGLSRLKLKALHSTSAVIRTDYTDEFLEMLPFKLTGAQKRAVGDCYNDMISGHAMNRLIQGDVGSGKTAVAAAVIYNCVKNGFQAAVMAPTEVLAQQHFKTFSSFFENTGIRIALLTGSVTPANKKIIKQKLADGEIDLLIGTHAIIQKDVIFSGLGLAVTDEQHRFGVNQRAMLGSKGVHPHIMVMSATPIPRTLSLIVYGDLDLSILDEMPAGRQKTETFLVGEDVRERAYGYVKKHLCDGYQGYIVCPLVDVDEDDDNAENEKVSSVKLFKELSDGFFKGFRLGLLYGKMKPDEKKSVMNDFADGKTDLLISTTVIEVGVDVPNAVIMVIENAESFGLSQLHQLRGRIGRGNVKSTCILVSDSKDIKTQQRLKILTSTTDGFKIADEDLRLRGPGDFIGQRQHGLPDIKSGNMLKDGETVRETHTAAESLLKNNPTLEGGEYDLIKARVNKMFSKGITLN
ncbi:MAG: ATP-dependent DNA helicase RecG [Clostridia bacterium]|nr:ATP-dependent DNA helicase RecG [Clostridia bacterium]